jgi:hypothetical protein
MSLAIGCWLVVGGTGCSEQQSAMSIAILKSTFIERKDSSHLFRDVNDVRPVVAAQVYGFNQYNVHKPRDPSQVKHADVSDFSWLFK